MAELGSRRSFLVELLTWLAGAFAIFTGAGALGSACGEGAVAKYGGPPDGSAADAEDDAGPVVKYGGPPSDSGTG